MNDKRRRRERLVSALVVALYCGAGVTGFLVYWDLAFLPVAIVVSAALLAVLAWENRKAGGRWNRRETRGADDDAA